MRKPLLLIAVTLLAVTACYQTNTSWKGNRHIKPWVKNRSYWQYKGKPVLLMGATDNDNLFQNDNLLTHLDSLKEAGGNYIRNTMSDRDPGDLHAFGTTAGGKYDLNTWNAEYWGRFENLLRLARERDIIVQIEIWDRFDHSRDPWKTDPFNPANNINYTFPESGLDSIYPLHPGQNFQPFFFSVPELDNNNIILKYQQLFVDKLLSISLNYDNILYCIDNETSGKEEWSAYWAEYIKRHSKEKDIYITEMWDNWDVKSETHKRTMDHPEKYGFIDISQNSQIPGPDNWKNAQHVFQYIKENPRPVNSTKIYGSDRGSWLDRGITTEHAVNTFFRNVLGGFASSRFHRPPSGLGLSSISINCIRSVRKIETVVKMWDIFPRMDLIEPEGNIEVYLSAKEGSFYIVYFAQGGRVKLNLSEHAGDFKLKSIDTARGEWIDETLISGGSVIEIEGEKRFIAVLLK